MSTSRGFVSGPLVLGVAGVLLFLVPAVGVEAWGSPAQANDNKVAQEIQGKLKGKQYQNVKVAVNGDGTAVLTGNVDLYEYKADADKKAHKTKGVKAVENDIQVAGPQTSDAQLQEKLQQEVNYSRVGYGTTTFNAVKVSVNGGDVTLSGHVYDYIDRNEILALVQTTPGVKDVTDDMQVDPTSIMDDQIRVRVAQAIYSYPTLQKYWINPVKPIRISVQNGHVELDGAVDSKADKDVAYLRANQVPGVFSVKNNLQVEGQTAQQSKEK